MIDYNKKRIKSRNVWIEKYLTTNNNNPNAHIRLKYILEDFPNNIEDSKPIIHFAICKPDKSIITYMCRTNGNASFENNRLTTDLSKITCRMCKNALKSVAKKMRD